MPGKKFTAVDIEMNLLLPRIIDLCDAKGPVKRCAAETLHACVLWLFGLKGTNINSHLADHKSELVPTWKQIFPTMIKLSVDGEPITRQLFSTLLEQTIRFFGRSHATLAEEREELVAALTEAVAAEEGQV